ARYVAVSEATVSRVLNGKPGISDATRTSVLTALDVLGYERPSKLRGERARLVGLVLPELQNPIFPAFADVVADTLARRGFTPVLCTRTTHGVSEADYVDLLLDQHVSGVIFAGGLYAQAAAEHDHYHRLRERGLPVVLVNAAIEDLGFACVATDDAHAVDQAYQHLASLGHERIGVVRGAADDRTAADRDDGPGRRGAAGGPGRGQPGTRRRDALRARTRGPRFDRPGRGTRRGGLTTSRDIAQTHPFLAAASWIAMSMIMS